MRNGYRTHVSQVQICIVQQLNICDIQHVYMYKKCSYLHRWEDRYFKKMQKAKENEAFVSLFILDSFVDVRLIFDVLAVQY